MKSRNSNSESGFTLIEVIITLVIVAVVAAMMTAYFGTGITQSSIPIFRLSNMAKLNEIMEKITTEYNNSPPTWSQGKAYVAGGPTAGTIVLPTARNGYQYICTVAGTSGTVEPGMGGTPPWPTTPGGTVTETTGTGVQWTYSGTTPPKQWMAGTAYNVNAVVYPSTGAGIGNQYICTVGGTSGTVEPTPWPTTSGGTVIETTGSTPKVQWTYRGPQPTLALQTAIGTAGTEGTTATDVTKTFGGENLSYRVIQNSFIHFRTSNTEVNINSATGDADYGKYLKVTIALPSGAGTNETLTTLFVRR